MTEELIPCPQCRVGFIPDGGVCSECEHPDPRTDRPGTTAGAGQRTAGPRGMTLDEFRAWLDGSPELD